MAKNNLMDYLRVNSVYKKNLIRDVLECVQAIHNSGISHLDLKQENILMMDRKPVLCDFSVSSFSKYFMDNTCCSLPYRPPEILCEDNGGQRAIDTNPEKIDVWSTALIILEIYKGEFIFRKDIDPQVLYGKIMDGKTLHKHLGKVDSVFKDLIEKMTTIEPKKRINIKEALEHSYFK